MKELELDQIYNLDCLDGMKHIPDGSIDAIICDLPYGTMKGANIEGWVKAGRDTSWDEVIPTDQLFEQYKRVIKRNGSIILFSQEPYTSHLRTFPAESIEFCYPMIWEKDHYGNPLVANIAPVSYFEDISIFRKRQNITSPNHPLRPYFQTILEQIKGGKAEVMRKIGGKADHTFRSSSTQFSLCTEQTYNELIEVFGIDKMQGFKPFAELVAINEAFDEEKSGSVFNLPEGKQVKSNILKYGKDTDGFHPTQKPVALIADLIRTYSNEGDTILDNCMGSGTTAVACIKEKRHFIGFELNKDYYDKACRRIDAERRQLSLF